MFRILLTFTAAVLSAATSFGQTTRAPKTPASVTSLDQLSTSLQSVAARVEPAVVQIFSSSYAADRGSGDSVVLQQRGSGSGILISADGYIVTNAHVVEGARRLQVRLHPNASSLGSRLLTAKLVGRDRETDIAVIKIPMDKLPFLAFADSDALSQGQIVLAFGSPLGLNNSVSMGVVSAVDRQLSLDDPAVYIQTDAAINPGNSGGPLVNTSGQVVGMNTLILTKSGGNEGVGFAIPGNLVNTICQQIRVDHHVHHHQIGIAVRAITPAMAQGLKFMAEDGVVIEDVAPLGNADIAGLKAGDIINKVEGQSIQNVRQFAMRMYSYAVGDKAQIEVLRGTDRLSFSVPVVERGDDPERFGDLVTEKDNSIAKLGILGLSIDEKVAGLMPPLRAPGGVLVAAKTVSPARMGDDLAVGDVIHAINGADVKDIASLRAKLGVIPEDYPMVFKVERAGRFQFVVIESN